MDIHVATVQPLNPPNIAVPKYSVHKTGEEWEHTKKTTGVLIIHLGQMNAEICPDNGKPQDYRHLMKGPKNPKRTRSFANEIGILFQGIRDIEGTNTCFFIHNHEVPQCSKVTYSRIVCDIRPRKNQTHRVKLTVGGDTFSYKGPVSAPTSYLTTAKLHWNIVLYTPDGK